MSESPKDEEGSLQSVQAHGSNGIAPRPSRESSGTPEAQEVAPALTTGVRGEHRLPERGQEIPCAMLPSVWAFEG